MNAPSRRFTWKTLLVLLLAVACFFAGVRFERERQRRADETLLQVVEKQAAPQLIYSRSRGRYRAEAAVLKRGSATPE